MRDASPIDLAIAGKNGVCGAPTPKANRAIATSTSYKIIRFYGRTYVRTSDTRGENQCVPKNHRSGVSRGACAYGGGVIPAIYNLRLFAVLSKSIWNERGCTCGAGLPCPACNEPKPGERPAMSKGFTVAHDVDETEH
jgi:hypothetical protein